MPWPLWVYSVAMLLGTISIEVKVHGPVLAKVLFAAIMLAWLYSLLKGVRWVWMATILCQVDRDERHDLDRSLGLGRRIALGL
jgi:hypothetical protein